MPHIIAFFSWSALCLLAAATPAVAQDKAADPWSLSGGFDLIELRTSKGDTQFLLDGTFYWGDNKQQLMLVTQGGGALGNQIDKAQARLFYGRTVGNVTFLGGVRKDIKSSSRDTHAAVGAQGVVGTRLNWETYVFLSDNGRLTGEAQVIYQLPITQRLYLEPRIAAGWAAQASVADAVRPGPTEMEATLRLRYRLTPKFNLYTAVAHERLLGGTRRLGRIEDSPLQSTVAVVGFGINL